MEQKENRAVLRGTVAGDAVLSHQVHGIDFYRFPLAVPRLSGREDVLNILCPGPLSALPPAGEYVEITGQVRSFNNRSGVGSRLVITVLARASPRSCARRPWGGTSATCCWRSTVATGGPITCPVSPGGPWPCAAGR